MKRLPKLFCLFCVSIGGAFFSSALQAQEVDIDALLAKAKTVASPLDRPYFCDPKDDLITPKSAKNNLVKLTLTRLCLPNDAFLAGLGLALPPSPSGYLAIEGHVENLHPDTGISLPEAYKSIQLELAENVWVLGSWQIEDHFMRSFKGALDPGAEKPFVTLYAVPEARNFAAIHPAQAGLLRMQIAKDGVLINGTVLPAQAVVDEKKPEVIKTPETVSVEKEIIASSEASTKTSVVGTPVCPEPLAVPLVAENEVFALTLTAVCLASELGGSETAVVIVGQVSNMLPDQPLAMLDIAEMFELDTQDAPIAPMSDLSRDMSPGFSTELPQGENRAFAAVFDLGNDWSGQAEFIVPAGNLTTRLDVSALVNAVMPEKPKAAKSVFGQTKDVPNEDAPNEETSSEEAPTLADTTPDTQEDVSETEALETPEIPVTTQNTGFTIGYDYAQFGRLPISYADLGGQVVATSGQMDTAGKDAVLDGIVSHDTSTLSIAEGQTSSLTVAFHRGRTAQISAFAVISTAYQSGDFHVPDHVTIATSENGAAGPFVDISAPIDMQTIGDALYITLAEPIAANAVRFSFDIDPTGNPVRNTVVLRELQVFEAQSGPSILHDVEVDMATDARGLRVAAHTTPSAGDSNSLYSSFDPDGVAFWPDETPLPQRVTYALRDFGAAEVVSVGLQATPQDASITGWAPKIRVEVSEGRSPAGSFDDLGFMEIDTATWRAQLIPDMPVNARFIRLSIVDYGGTRFGIDDLSINLRPASFDPVIPSLAGHQGQAFDHEEVEPNDTPDQAVALQVRQTVLGRPDFAGDVDYYRFNVPPVTGQETEPRIVNLTLNGVPRVKSTLVLSRDDGEELYRFSPDRTLSSRTFTWKLDPGDYVVSLSEAGAGVVIVIDDSGSMGRAIGVARDAARLFVEGKVDEERIGLIRFSGVVNVISELTEDQGPLLDRIDEIPSDTSNGGTSVFDAVAQALKMLDSAASNPAIVLLTDGEDVSSELTYPELLEEITRRGVAIHTIGLGGAMVNRTSAIGGTLVDMLQSISLHTGGDFYRSPAAADLQDVYAKIAERLRDRGSYTLRLDIPEGDGYLSVREDGRGMAAVKTLGKVHFILDASGSMKAATDEGRQRINVARTVFWDLLKQLPEEVPVGLRVYGHNLPSKPKAASCKDTELILQPMTEGRDGLKKFVGLVTPRGQTPIGLSLLGAAADLQAAEKNLIILLTDGEETCVDALGDAYHPELVAQFLINEGYDVRVNIVGFDVDDTETQDSLRRVARITGGEFYYGDGENGLRNALLAALVPEVVLLDDLDQIIAQFKVGDPRLKLPPGTYRLKLAEGNLISQRQRVLEGEETRITLAQEASDIRITSEQASLEEWYDQDMAAEFDPTVVSAERRALARFPQSQEETTYRVQFILEGLGYDPGPRDGAMGGKTRRAIESYLNDLDEPMVGPAYFNTGAPTQFLWISLLASYLETVVFPRERAEFEAAKDALTK